MREWGDGEKKRWGGREMTKHFKFRIAECKKRNKELGRWGDNGIGRNEPYVGLP